MLTFLVVVSTIVQLLVTIYTFIKGRQNASYLLFTALSSTILGWAVLNYLSVVFEHTTYLTVIVRLIMFFVVIQIAVFHVFAKTFPDKTIYVTTGDFLRYLTFTAVTAITVLSPYMFSSVVVENGVTKTQIGAGILVFLVYVVWYITSAFRVLITKLRYAVGLKRIQLLILLAVSILNWIIVPTTNFVLTLTLKTFAFVVFAPVYSMLFAGIIAYALVKHRMFDDKTKLNSSTIYVNHYLKNQQRRSAEFYELQSLVYKSDSNHVALDFSGVKNLDKESVSLVIALRKYMKKQGKKLYFIGYSQKVFEQLRPNE